MAEQYVSLLPNNSTQFERALEQVFSDNLPSEQAISTLWNADTIPSNLLGALAWSLSVDDWQDTWSDAVKRSVVKASYGVHAQKGSVASIKAVLAASGYPQAQVIENTTQQAAWQALGGLYLNSQILLDGQSFSVDTSPNSMTTHWAEYLVEFNLAQAPVLSSDQASLRKRIESTAPARCKLAALLYKFSQEFFTPILINSPINAINIAFKDCQAFSLHKPKRIDGCYSLSGDYIDTTLMSTASLDGTTSLQGRTPIGDLLTQGWGEVNLSIAQQINFQSRASSTDNWTLGKTYHDNTLNGENTLGSAALNGQNFLTGIFNLSLALLSKPFYKILNGSNTLGKSKTQINTCFNLKAALITQNNYTEIAL